MFELEAWIAIDAVSAAVLVILFAATHDGSVLRSRQRRFFRRALCMMAGLVLVDVLAHLLQGVPGVSFPLAFLQQALIPVCLFLGVAYAASCIEVHRAMPTWWYVANGVVCAADIIFLSVMATAGVLPGPFGSLVPSDGWIWWAQAAFLCIYLVVDAIFFLVRQVRIGTTTAYSLLLAMAIIIVGVGLQLIVSNTMILPAALAVAALSRYAVVQAEGTSVDFLTGIWNRRALDRKLDQLVRSHRTFGGLLIDIDEFKNINDRFGHVTGDAVLVEFSKLLVDCFRVDDTVARYGGDEFFVIVEVNDEAILSLITKRVRETLIRFNEESALPCEVQISIGSALYVPGDGIDDLRDKAKRASSALEYVNRLDAAMYAEKAQKRILRGNVQSYVSA